MPLTTILQIVILVTSQKTHLMIQEKLSQQAEMLAIYFAEMTVDFEDRNVFFTIYFVAGRVGVPAAFADVALEDAPTLHVLETELAYEEFRESGVFLRVRRRIPSLNLKNTKFDGGRIPTGRGILLVKHRL